MSLADRFEILGELARGGMGVVYRARQREPEREVALKQILGDAFDDDSLDRFQREAEALGRLDHPGVVRVHEVGVRPPYLVMEFVRGRSLAAHLKHQPGGRSSPREAALLVAALADAVAHAHERGVLHRDIKPANVIVREDGAPTLIDFGLTRVQGSEIERLTQTGEVLGTPSYMAPEQALGVEVDERTDVYGLGALLYQLLTGSPPFVGSAPLAVLNAVVTEPPADPRSQAPGVDRGLARICLQALEKDAEDRHPNARALGDALQGWLAGEDSGGTFSPALGAALTLLVLASLGGLVALAQPARPPAPPTPTSAPTLRPALNTQPASTPLSLRELRTRFRDLQRPSEVDPGDFSGALKAWRELVLPHRGRLRSRDPQSLWAKLVVREPIESQEIDGEPGQAGKPERQGERRCRVFMSRGVAWVSEPKRLRSWSEPDRAIARRGRPPDSLFSPASQTLWSIAAGKADATATPPGRRLAAARLPGWLKREGVTLRLAAYDPNHARLALACRKRRSEQGLAGYDNWLELWDVKQGKRIKADDDWPTTLRTLEFSPQGGYLLCSSSDGSHDVLAAGDERAESREQRFAIYRVPSLKVRHNETTFYRVAAFLDEDSVALGSHAGPITRFELSSAKTAHIFGLRRHRARPPRAVASHTWRGLVAYAGLLYGITSERLWCLDPSTGKEVYETWLPRFKFDRTRKDWQVGHEDLVVCGDQLLIGSYHGRVIAYETLPPQAAAKPPK